MFLMLILYQYHATLQPLLGSYSFFKILLIHKPGLDRDIMASLGQGYQHAEAILICISCSFILKKKAHYIKITRSVHFEFFPNTNPVRSTWAQHTFMSQFNKSCFTFQRFKFRLCLFACLEWYVKLPSRPCSRNVYHTSQRISNKTRFINHQQVIWVLALSLIFSERRVFAECSSSDGQCIF